MPDPGACAEHSGMTEVLKRVEIGVEKLWDKHDETNDKIATNNDTVINKLNDLEKHFIKQAGAQDRRKLDRLKSLGKNLLKAAGWILALGLTGGLSFATAYGAILKYWR